MDHSDGNLKVQYVKTPLGTSHWSDTGDSVATQSSLKCVSDDADDVSAHVASWRCRNCGTPPNGGPKFVNR